MNSTMTITSNKIATVSDAPLVCSIVLSENVPEIRSFGLDNSDAIATVAHTSTIGTTQTRFFLLQIVLVKYVPTKKTITKESQPIMAWTFGDALYATATTLVLTRVAAMIQEAWIKKGNFSSQNSSNVEDDARDTRSKIETRGTNMQIIATRDRAIFSNPKKIVHKPCAKQASAKLYPTPLVTISLLR
ncbi:unnamed protein product [Pseudo-nitzschia multistriata]|uniref:Uncharacterized protein n=1 Tax=Pseudo-nitzschia multistriata TaxID=183589 RepID=A0A448YYI3_9STRA|nr:unnamed protein product [Pseudo-nitzschia multistriata]